MSLFASNLNCEIGVCFISALYSIRIEKHNKVSRVLPIVIENAVKFLTPPPPTFSPKNNSYNYALLYMNCYGSQNEHWENAVATLTSLFYPMMHGRMQ